MTSSEQEVADSAPEHDAPEHEVESDLDLEARVLCADGACIGVVHHGVCQECGEASHVAEVENIDLRRRSLCSEGTCVGVIGADGRCKECGLVSPDAIADPRLRGLRPESSADPIATVEASASIDFDTRTMCPDGACIGILDDDGTCPECGAIG